jgi:basic amino acid/polyamine antiporter, APA family
MLAALWAYDGWNNMPMAAGEVKDPGRNVPRALIGGMVAVMAIYCAANLAYFYALPWVEVLTSNSTAHRDALPIATKAAQTAFGDGGGKLMSIAFVVSALGALNGATLTGARVPFAMARDGLFPARAGVLDPRTRVPVAAVLMQASWASVLAASGTYDQLTDYVVFASWIFYGLVTSAVFVLRFRAPELPRPYRTFAYPVVPLVFVLVAAWLVVNTLVNRPVESVAGLVLIAVGMPVYWYFHRAKRSAAARTPGVPA